MASAERVDFFVSYTSVDRPWAEWIAWVLEDAGYRVRIQAWDFGAGSNFVLAMDEAARVSRRTVAVLSPAYLESGYAGAEWAAAWRADPTGQERTLLPVRVREFDAGGLLGAIVHVDLVGVSEELARERLLSEASGDRAKPVAAPGFPGVWARNKAAPALPSGGAAIWNVPPVRGRFVGREALLEDLSGRALGPAAAAPTQVSALHGLGGVGKTRVAVEFARRHRSEYDVVWWVRSEDPVTMLADFAGLADALALPEQSEREQDARAAAVSSWLAANRRWLLVFDNAPGPDALDALMPDGDGGHVLITSRRQGGWRGIADPYAVDVWPRGEPVAFLQRRTGDDDDRAADAVADALGDLPLALEQAAAYADSVRISLAAYCDRLESHAPKLFEHGRSPDYGETVATTWELAFAEVEEDPGRRALLFCGAFLASEQVPRELFASDAIADGVFAGPDGDLALDEAIRGLLAFSLVTSAEGYLSIHRLVQHVIRHRLGDERDRWRTVSEHLVGGVFPDEAENPRTWPACERLLPHALSITDHAREADAESAHTATLLSRVASYLYVRAELGAAKELWQRALRLFEGLYGPDHPQVASTLGNLGPTLRELGDLEGAREQLQRAQRILERVHGPDHPEVARTLTNLGNVLRQLGDPEAAREQQQRALRIKEGVYGPDHPEVASTLTSLGNVLRQLGDLKGARQVQQRALRIREGVYGPDHPQVAITLGNLGVVLQELGDLEGAREQQRRALRIFEGVYGLNHPRVARTLGNLGMVLLELGDLEGAREQQQRALRIFEGVYEPDHPRVAATLANLGLVLEELGDPEAARQLQQRAQQMIQPDDSREGP